MMQTNRRPLAIGERFGRLTVVGAAEPKIKRNGYPIYRVLARCECGKDKIVNEYKLRCGSTRSCGCLQLEAALQKLPKPTHGMTRSPTYSCWQSMKSRCLNTAHTHYDRYGGRGIKICQRWMSFENFHEDMGTRPEGTTIDRINNDGDYEPSNCRWATWLEQAANRSNTKLVVLDGEILSTSQANKRFGLTRSAILKRSQRLGLTHQETVDLYSSER